MRWEPSLCTQLAAMQSPKACSISRRDWWRSRSKSLSRIRRAWPMSSTMCSIRTQLGRVARQTWNSRSFMRTGAWCCRCWRLSPSSSMTWRLCMRTPRPRPLISAPKSMNSSGYSQCRATSIWNHISHQISSKDSTRLVEGWWAQATWS